MSAFRTFKDETSGTYIKSSPTNNKYCNHTSSSRTLIIASAALFILGAPLSLCLCCPDASAAGSPFSPFSHPGPPAAGLLPPSSYTGCPPTTASDIHSGIWISSRLLSSIISNNPTSKQLALSVSVIVLPFSPFIAAFCLDPRFSPYRALSVHQNPCQTWSSRCWGV